VGIRREPIRFILLEFERTAKVPREVEAVRIRRPRGLEKTMLTMTRMKRVMIERVL